jgi:hypothetical protein
MASFHRNPGEFGKGADIGKRGDVHMTLRMRGIIQFLCFDIQGSQAKFIREVFRLGR